MIETMTRKIPIDFAAIAFTTGIWRGTIGRIGDQWVVQNPMPGGPADIVIIDPPPMQPGETFLRIEDNHWCFYTDQEANQ